MGVISLRNGALYLKGNNFILHQLMGLMAEQLPGDAEADEAFKRAEAVSALQLDLYEPAVAERLEKVMLRVAHAVVDGRLPLRSPILQDPESRAMFVRGMRDLLNVMVHPVEGGSAE